MMGMFDSFEVEIVCPYTNKKVDGLVEFQTKQFDCVLQNWKIGDKFTENVDGSKINGAFSVYGSCHCESCKENSEFNYGRWIIAKMVIENGIVSKCIDIQKDEPQPTRKQGDDG